MISEELRRLARESEQRLAATAPETSRGAAALLREVMPRLSGERQRQLAEEMARRFESRADAAFTAFIRLIVPGLSPGVLGLSALRAGIGSVTLASVTGASRGTQPKPLLMQPPIRGYGYFEDFPAIPVFAR